MAIIGYGCNIQISSDGGSTYANLGTIEDFDLPSIKATIIRVSNIQQSNKWHQKRGGMIDGGDLKFKMFFLKADYATILGYVGADQIVAGTNTKIKITFSDLGVTASTAVFNGFVAEMAGVAPLDDKIMCNMSVAINGIITFTAGT